MREALVAVNIKLLPLDPRIFLLEKSLRKQSHEATHWPERGVFHYTTRKRSDSLFTQSPATW
jgi:hypothetical protein